MAESVHKINGNDDNNNNDNDNNNSSSNSSSSSSSSKNSDNENNDHEHNQKYPIQSCVVLMAAITIPNLPTIESLDDYATVETFTHCKFPNYLSLWSMGILRLVIGGIVFSLTTYLVCISEGWDLYANYLQHTKLQRVVIKITGVRALCAFTSFSWILLGIGFVSRGLICVAFYLVEQQQQEGSNNDDDDDDVTKNWDIPTIYTTSPYLVLTFDIHRMGISSTVCHVNIRDLQVCVVATSDQRWKTT
eukprot:CAMPEP_0171053916 /NCGR_PEP_ID=MMETSP0736-20130129/54784_1 /TAXON_ID=186038 /ORGANISM="Fragilariopsis kerguelensis, Strain L26-C5" /LENGTH=246 /DNA_ID=CAMNT_0011507977 /DNA_START=81 /DNA_END=821 /DNA_ORIENTATION=+